MDNNRPFNRRPKSIIFMIVLLAIVLVAMYSIANSRSMEKYHIEETVFYEKFKTTESGTTTEVAGVLFYGQTVYGVYVSKDGESPTTEEKLKKLSTSNFDFYFEVAYSSQIEDIRNVILEYNKANPDKPIELKTRVVGPNFFEMIIPYLYIGMIIILGYFIYKTVTKMSGRNMDFGKNKARMEAGLKVRFADVAGCDEEKQEMQEIVEFLKNPRKFTELGARIPKGVLLVGPPGTGKTLLAKAIAGEAGVPFFSITGSDFVEMYVGVGAARVRDLFDTAKRNMPCLVFIDEIDAVGRQRGAGLGNTNDEREQTLNQLLVQMDGFESNDGIVVIAATNRPDVLDPALLRAGRFDRRIVVNRPDLSGRVKILKLYADNKPFADDIDWEGIARRLPGTTGADIENILNEAAILAARDNRNLITETDIFESTLKTQYGLSKKNHKVEEDDRITTAYHESGHAILNKLLTDVKIEVQEVTIIPRGMGGGMSGGMTSRIPEREYSFYNREQLMTEIISAMGGRAAEKIKFNHFSTGASNDIQVATDVARDMVTKYGMSEKLGSVCYAEEGEIFLGRDFQQRSNISDDTARIIDEEIKVILDEGLARAMELLKKNWDIVEEMAKVLLARETIYADEVNELMSRMSADDVIKAMDERAAQRKQRDAEALERKKAEKQAEAEKQEKMYSDLDRHLLGALHDKHTPIDIEKKQMEQEAKLSEENVSEQKSDKKNDDGTEDKK
ncbi:MAG: ATP-dependent zinc metalloprotease FtsH [Clostridia bacterium]|nr:ATP-dependent zinc metalloprotease FtsH [Clostridia bacterium]